MPTAENVNIDTVIEHLLEVRKRSKIEKIEFKENDIQLIIHKAYEMFSSQSVLLELDRVLNMNFSIYLSNVLNRNFIEHLS
jgi:hypothetical protein